MEEFSLRDILAITLRRKNYFLVTAGVVFVLGFIFILNWSNYRSTATVQIEQSYIDTNVTNPSETIATLADQRINQIQQKVTSLESLDQIITKFDLYPGMKDDMPVSALTTKMRNKIKVDFISGTVANPVAAQKQTAEQLSAIAFDLSFDYSDPQKAQAVTDELVTRFLDEDLKMRRRQAQETSAFIDAQIKAMENSMAEQEKAIADFNAKNGETGPAALMFNQQSASQLAMSIRNIESQMTSNEGTQGAIKAQLALVDPYSRVLADGQMLTTPSVQLKALEAQYTTLTSRYGPDHPDVVKARSQIAALKAEIAPSVAAGQLKSRLIDLQTNLEAARQTKGPDHPDIKALEAQIAKTEKDIAAAEAKGGTAPGEIKRDADNPAYLQLSAQLESAEAQHKALEDQHKELMEQQAKYQQTIAMHPMLEQEMAKLTRDYENSQMRYRELKEKKMTADMNEQLELGRKGQRLVVTNPPSVPNDTQPRRWLLILADAVLSGMAGICAIVVVEIMMQSVHGANHLSYIVGAAPLVTIPYIRTDEEKNLIRRFRPYLLVLAAVVNIVKALIAAALLRPVRLVRNKIAARKSSQERPHG